MTVSSDLKNYVHRTTGINPEKIKVIYNSVDTDYYSGKNAERQKIRPDLGIKESDFLIGSVGRLAEVKNFSCLIDAMKTVSEKCPDAKLIIIGDGPLYNDLNQQIKGLGLENTVKLLGQRNDVPDLLCAMDIYVLPSLFEGISISILEAMAAGLPVIATSVGGNPEIVLDNETGYLVKSNDPHDLAQKIIQSINNKNKLALFSKAAVRRVHKVFHNDVMVAAYSELYL